MGCGGTCSDVETFFGLWGRRRGGLQITSETFTMYLTRAYIHMQTIKSVKDGEKIDSDQTDICREMSEGTTLRRDQSGLDA